MSGLEIRLAGTDDAEVVASLVGGFRDFLRVRSPADEALRSVIPGALADPTLEFACAWLAGEPVGYTHTRYFEGIWGPGPEAYLEDLFVVESARGQGVGGALLRHALARARESLS